MSLAAHSFRDLSFAICDRPTARRELLCRGSTWSHVVSIGDPGAREVPRGNRGLARFLRLEFDDVTPGEDHGRTPAEIRARFGYIAATREQIQQIVTFGENLPPGARVLVHCEQGKKRSPAAVGILLMSRYPDIFWPDAAAAIRQARPQATPNAWMVQLYMHLRAEQQA